jgi:hypothetical protein
MYAEVMQQIIAIVTPTFFTIALGYLFGRLSRSGTAALIDAAMYIAVPCLRRSCGLRACSSWPVRSS